jgi:hypothetical protein
VHTRDVVARSPRVTYGRPPPRPPASRQWGSPESVAVLDAGALVRARLTGARIDIETAIACAAAHGLHVDLAGPSHQTPTG